MTEPVEASFWDHLEELRRRLLTIIVALAAATVGSFFGSRLVVRAILATGPDTLQTLAPAEAFTVHLRVSLVCGILITSPILFYQFWRFVSPGLYQREKRPVLAAVFFSVLLFLTGAALAWTVLLEPAVALFRSFETGPVSGNWTLSNYVGFLGRFVLVFGLAFQMPLMVMFLVRLGAVSPQALGKYRRHVFIFLLIAAALLTPPDPVTQVALALPLYFLYEISALAARLTGRRSTPG